MPAKAHAQARDEPAEQDFDRFLLTNGEVHDGRFAGVRDGNYRLESEGFGTLRVHPQYVREIHLLEPRRMYAKEGPRAREERITLGTENGRLIIMRRNGEPDARPFEPDRFQRVQLEPIPFAVWNLNVQGTVTITRGNADTLGAGVAAQLTRTSDFDEFLLGYEFGFQETELDDDSNVVSERFHRAELSYRYYVDAWWGLFAHNAFRHNLISGIELWNSLQGGLTVAPAWSDPLTLTADLGIMWTYRDLTGEPGEHFVGGSAATVAAWKVNNRLGFRFRAGFDVNFEETDNWNGLLRLTSTMRLHSLVAAGFQAELTYANQPAPGFNATDFRMVATLGIVL